MSTSDLDYKLYFDRSTTLPNKLLLREQFENSLQVTQKGQQPELVPVVVLELEPFDLANKPLNTRQRETLFKEIGKRLLKKVWGIINVTRLSPKRFAIILSSPEPDHTTVDMLQDIQSVLVMSFAACYLQPILLKRSLGVAFYPCDGYDLATLIANAEKALLEVKAEGGGDYRFYTPTLGQPRTGQGHRSSSTVGAGQPSPLVPDLFFQPQFNFRTGHITGAQAFAAPRLNGCALPQDSDMLDPDAEADYEAALKKSELYNACLQARKWFDQGNFAAGITVKLAAAELCRDSIDRQVAQVLAETGLEPGQLVLEVGSEQLFHEVSAVAQNLTALKALGVGLALGNIENGYSTLMSLKRFPFDRLHLDLRVFNKFIKARRSDKRQILASICETVHEEGMQILFSEVTAKKDLKLLEGLACDFIQGSQSGPLLQADEFADLFLSPVA